MTSLAKHHIYGSSRLGIQRYITGQKAYDPVTPTVGSGSGAAQPLVQKRAWYSMWGNDLFAPITATGTAASDPLSTDNMGTTGIGIQPHMLGNRHYELTNHLGNVMATILDRSTPRLVNSSANNKDSLVGYSADISSAQDYYPFGMLMPGRYISDNSPQCITTQQTTLVPKTVRVYIDLTPAPHLPFPGGPIIATPYPWGPIKDLPIEASFRQQQARFNHYLPAEEHPGGFAARALPGGGGYELDLSDEPSGLSLYLPFGIDTGGSQVLGFGVGMLPAGVRLEARVRHYGADTSSEEYTEPVRWRNVRAGEQVELRFGLPAGAAGKLVAELRFSAEGGAGKFGSGRRVEIRDPWIEKTEWTTESRLVTLCDEKDKYRYGFNGQEKDNEVKGLANSLDFGARIYDPRLGRWLSTDPLANKYPSLSLYNFTGNNPIMFVDPDGKKIVVYDKGKPYQYTPGVKPAPGSPDILFKVHESAMYSMQTKTGAEVWKTVGSSQRVVNVSFKDATPFDQKTNEFRATNISGRKEDDLELGNLDWDYNSRVITSGGLSDIEGKGLLNGYLSPSTVLLHELGHAYLMEKALSKGLNSKEWSNFKTISNVDMGQDKQYDKIEEREVIENIERPYVNEINEIEGENGSYQRPRYNHDGFTELRKNDADVNKNPSKSEQQKQFDSPY